MPIWITILLRSISLLILVLFFSRIMGNRNIARQRPFGFICYTVIAIISALISAGIIANLSSGFITLGVWVLFSIAADYLAVKSKWFHDLVNGKEIILVKHGKIMEESLLKARLTGEELLRELRSKNAFNFSDVEFALMEATGDINVYLKSDKKPVTPHDLGQKVAPQTEPQTIILDGNVLNDPLASMGLNQGWLNVQLQNMGVSLDNVFLGQVDSSGDLYVDLYDDSIRVPQPKIKEMLYASLEKSQASLITFSLETKDEKARAMYSKDSERLKALMSKLEPYLLR